MNLVSPVLALAGGDSQRDNQRHQFMSSFEEASSLNQSSEKGQMDELYRQKIEELQQLEAKMA